MSAPKSILYTGTGDKGTTSLVSGHRIAKHHMRIEAYGTIDELNSHIGLAIALPALPHEQKQMLQWIQNKLFDLGAYLANDLPDTHPGVTPSDILRLQAMIDTTDAALPPLRRFVLPGGTVEAAQLHIARTVCRRAERRVTALADTTQIAPDAIIFVNRLSDLLFAMARLANICTDTNEIFWEKNC